MGFKGVGRYIKRRAGIAAQEGFHTAAVVIMAVGKDGNIHRSKVDAQFLGVFREGIGFSHIEENALTAGFDIKAQSMLRPQVRTAGCILQKYGDFHASFAPFTFFCGFSFLLFTPLAYGKKPC